MVEVIRVVAKRLVPLTAVFVLLTVAGASASVRLGPDLTPVQNGGVSYGCQPGKYSPCSFVNLRTSEPVAAPVAAPFNGVITKWRFRAGCCTEPQTESKTMTLKTFLPGTQDGTFEYAFIIERTAGPSFVIPPGNQVIGDSAVELPARVPILAGERVGIVADDPIAFATYSAPTTLGIVTAAPEYVYNGERYGVAYAGSLAINADVEPDADGDGYGDETQDCQTSDPSLHGTDCLPPAAGSIPPPLPSGAKSGPCEGICGGGGVVFSAPPSTIRGPRGDGGIEVPLQCPPTATIPCGGILYVELPPGKKPRASTSKVSGPKILAKSKYSVQPGKKKTVRLTFSKSTVKFLALKTSRRVTVTIVPDIGQSTSTTKTLRYPRPKKP